MELVEPLLFNLRVIPVSSNMPLSFAVYWSSVEYRTFFMEHVRLLVQYLWGLVEV